MSRGFFLNDRLGDRREANINNNKVINNNRRLCTDIQLKLLLLLSTSPLINYY